MYLSPTSKNSVDTSKLFKIALNVLLKAKIIDHSEAIALEVNLLSKSAVKSPRINISKMLANINVRRFKYAYINHLRQRSLNKRIHKHPIVYSDVNDNSEPNEITLPCIACGFDAATLFVNWTESKYSISLPKYSIKCQSCGLEKDVEFKGEMLYYSPETIDLELKFEKEIIV